MTKPGPKPRPRKATASVEIRCTPVERAEIHCAAIVSGKRSTNQWLLDLALKAARKESKGFIAKHGRRQHAKIVRGVSE